MTKEVNEVWWNAGIVRYRKRQNNPNGKYNPPGTIEIRGNLELAILLAVKNEAILHIADRFACNFNDINESNYINRRIGEIMNE